MRRGIRSARRCGRRRARLVVGTCAASSSLPSSRFGTRPCSVDRSGASANELASGSSGASTISAGGAISAPGRYTLAVTPGWPVKASVVRSRTVASWRRASRPTTKSPIRLAVSEVTSPPSASRSFAARKSSADMPSPRSATSTRMPASTARETVTETDDSGGEYRSALSSSSAIRWPTSPAAAPTIETSPVGPTLTRR